MPRCRTGTGAIFSAGFQLRPIRSDFRRRHYSPICRRWYLCRPVDAAAGSAIGILCRFSRGRRGKVMPGETGLDAKSVDALQALFDGMTVIDLTHRLEPNIPAWPTHARYCHNLV